MSPEIVTMFGMTATILVATWGMNRSLRTEIRTEIAALRTEITDLRMEKRTEFNGVHTEITGLKEHMAHLEGLMNGLRETIVARSVT